MTDAEVQADLAAWLGQCIDEDEADALRALAGHPSIGERDPDVVPAVWEQRYHHVRQIDERTPEGDTIRQATVANCGAGNVYPARHIVRWDPARVLVECDTKRQVIELHQPKTVTATEDGREVAESRCVKCADRYPCQTLRLQTLPFVERDGYREEWRP